MPIVGPGAAPQQVDDIRPLLEGATENEYITILNPLTDDFAVRVAQDVPVNMPTIIRSATALVQNEGDVVRNYGMNLKGKDFVGKKHIVNDTIIKAGQTINLKGNEAQVAVKQLVNEILQREGNTRLSMDPNLRNEIEQRIIIHRGNVQDLMTEMLQTPRNQIDEAIRKSNEANNEQRPIESTSQSPEGSSNSGTESSTQERRAPGRPRKDQSAPV